MLQQHHWQRLGPKMAHKSAEDLFQQTMPALEALSAMGSTLLKDSVDTPSVSNCLSIFLLQEAYQTCLALITMSYGAPDDQTREVITTYKSLMRILGRRWRLSGLSLQVSINLEPVSDVFDVGIFVTILDAQEASLLAGMESGV